MVNMIYIYIHIYIDIYIYIIKENMIWIGSTTVRHHDTTSAVTEHRSPVIFSSVGTRRDLRATSGTWPIHFCCIVKIMDVCQNLLLSMLVGWTPIYQLFWCSPGLQGFDPKPYISIFSWVNICKIRVGATVVVVVAAALLVKSGLPSYWIGFLPDVCTSLLAWTLVRR